MKMVKKQKLIWLEPNIIKFAEDLINEKKGQENYEKLNFSTLIENLIEHYGNFSLQTGVDEPESKFCNSYEEDTNTLSILNETVKDSKIRIKFVNCFNLINKEIFSLLYENNKEIFKVKKEVIIDLIDKYLALEEQIIEPYFEPLFKQLNLIEKYLEEENFKELFILCDMKKKEQNQLIHLLKKYNAEKYIPKILWGNKSD